MTGLHSNTAAPPNRKHRRKRRPERPGIILLVVLGMLTLFSVLAVSYLVFTSSQRSTARSIHRAETSNRDPQPWLDESLKQVMVGSNGPESSIWGHDLLGDLYGMRDAIQGQLRLPANYLASPPDNLEAPEVLLDAFVRVPTQLYTTATYPNQRTDRSSFPEREYPQTPGAAPTTSFPVDDSLTGRILTFTDGPLEGLSMRIVRYFGDNTGAPNGRGILSGQLVLDFRPHLHRSITIESVNETHTLNEWIEFNKLGTSDISLLFYDRIATATSGAVPLADFYINGGMLNGPGLGWDVVRDEFLAPPTPPPPVTMNLNETISVLLNPNDNNPPIGNVTGSVKHGTDFEGSNTGKDIPVALQGHYSLYRRAPNASPSSDSMGYLQDLPGGDTDEPYDAPDDQNWWLSYFPDNPAGTAPLGSPAPSFVRPGLIHWLVNQQRTSFTPTLQDLPVARLQEILRAIQRATLRPIPIINDPALPTSIPLRAPGVLQLDYSTFTAGHPANVAFGDAIDFQEPNNVVLANRIQALARQLVGQDVDADGRPDWDVDNNGDGIPDSVWIDLGLSLDQSDDGKLAKPLVAVLIEDLGGRVNVNLAGNLAQARPNPAIQRSADGVLYRLGAPGASATITQSDLPNGFGFGPAEIDIRPLFNDPTLTGTGPLNLLRQRLTSQTVGSVEYVAAGYLVDPRTNATNTGNDLLGVLRQPYLANLHRSTSSQGLPVDKFGRASVALGINGGLMVSGATAPVNNAGGAAGDSSDDPYEFDPAPGGQPDRLFTVADLEGILRFDDFDRDSLDSELVALAEAHFQNGTTSEINNARRDFANSITTVSNSAAAAVGTLPSEFRDRFPTAQRALPPQILLTSAPDNVLGLGVLNNQQRNAILMQLLPQEILAGGKLDLNRPFGNGIDDDGDGVVDDPQELRSAVEIFYRDFTAAPPLRRTVYTTGYSDVTVGEPGLLPGPFPEPTPQALFARHLYVMGMMLIRDHSTGTNNEFDFTHGNAGSITIDPSNRTVKRNPPVPLNSGPWVPNTAIDEYRAWRMAQWAINVADFRDQDAIMSRFDYDVFPFDGWDILGPPPLTGASQPTFRTVWGMEYPELALEESIAFHDRRIKDTNLDSAMEFRFQGGTFRDPDPDQWRLPQGSLFLELRSTREAVGYEVDRATGQMIRSNNTALDDLDNETFDFGRPRELYNAQRVSTRSGMDPETGLNRTNIDYYEPMLDLALTAPDRNPVWRVAITRAHPSPAASGASDPELSGDEMLQPTGSQESIGFTSATPQRLTATLQPEMPEFFGPAFTDAIDRVVWFTNFDPDDGFNPGTAIGRDNTANDGFVNFAPIDSQQTEKIFYNRFENADYLFQDTDPQLELRLRAGQHAVIGPRVLTNVGSLDVHSVGGQTHDATTSEPLVTYAEYESPQRFVLASNQFEHRLFTNTVSTPTIETGAGVANASIRPTVGIVAGANPPPGWPAAATIAPGSNGRAIGLSVSEPLPYHSPAGVDQYYRNPTQRLKAGFPLDSYYDFDNVVAGMSLPDTPFDGEPYAELYKVFDVASQQTGTRERFKTAYLQRLADPTQPHDESLNPYITVDYITIDLTVFNGSDSNRLETETRPPPGPDIIEWIDSADPDPFGSAAPKEAFATRYKTGRTINDAKDVALATNEILSHSVNTFPPAETNPATALGGHTPYFDHALGLDNAVNPDAGGSVNAVPAMPTSHSSTLGYANASYGQRWSQGATASLAIAKYVGTPFTTNGANTNWFSTATWLNRPFVSPGELMWVPTTSASRFGSQFGTATTGTGFTAAGNFYDGNGAAVGTRQEYDRAFPHLWNYFSGNANAFTTSPNLWRIMDWVTVAAPYDFENDFLSTNNDLLAEQAPPISPPPAPAYSETLGVDEPGESTFGGVFNYSSLGGPTATGNPNTWTSGIANSNAFWLNRWTIEAFRTPHNILNPPFRQGRINLNTIKNVKVYQALMRGITESSDPTQGAFYPAFATSRRGYTPSSTDPVDLNLDATNRVFNAARASQFAGAFRPSSASDIAPLGGPVGTNDRVAIPLGKTIMRPGGTIDTLGTSPLFSRPSGTTTIMDAWRPRSVAHDQLAVTRLNNLATDQSNVFAVWITVGLFEVDGTTLSVGQEVGSDLGQVRRYRSFQIIDRSVPVMYEPGTLNNALDAVLLSRRLQ